MAFALAIAGALAAVEPAAAGLNGVMPTDESGDPTYEFTSADALFVYAVSDIKGGRVCIVAAAVTDPAGASCDDPAWGSPNHIVSLGSYFGPLEAPALWPGQWRLLAEDSEYDPIMLSEVFEVSPCPGCSLEPALAAIQQWKDAATSAKTGLNLYCTAATYKEKLEDARSLDTTDIPALESFPISFGFTLGGGFGFGFPELDPFVVSQEKALEILKNLSCMAGAMYSDIADDPPDSGFDTVADPVVRAVDPSDFPADEPTALAQSLAELEGYGVASRVAFERYQGAAAAGDTDGVLRQLGATSEFTHDLVREMRGTADALETWATYADAQATMQGPVVATDEEGQAWQSAVARVAASGFDPDELAELQALGLDAAQIENVRATFARTADTTLTPQSLGDAARGLAASLRDEAVAFDAFAREAAAVAATVAANAVDDTPLTAVIQTDASSGVAPLTVRFDGSASTPAAAITSYAWDFGDGGASGEIAPDHTYFAAGTYTVALSVGRDDGTQQSATQQIVVDPPPNQPPVAGDDSVSLPAGTAQSIEVGANDGDPDGTIVSTDVLVPPAVGSASCAGGWCTYSAPPDVAGTLSFIYRVTDDRGATADAVVHITIVAPDVPAAAADAYEIARGATWVLLPLANDYSPLGALTISGHTAAQGTLSCEVGGTTCTYTATGAAESDSFTYTAVDPGGNTTTGTVTITIVDAATPPDLVFHLTTADISEGDGVQPAYTAAGRDGHPIVSRVWTVSDGRDPVTDASPSFAFPDDGEYDISLTVTDSVGLSTTAAMHVSVQNQPPSISRAGESWSRAIAGHARDLALSTYDSGPHDVVTVAWDFGDGATAAGADVSHAWAVAGAYVVRAVADDGAAQSVLEIPVEVLGSGVAPEVSLSADAIDVDEGTGVAFGSTVSDSDGAVAGIVWDFGDGTAGPGGEQASHTFMDEGVYPVTIVVHDDTGLSTSAQVVVTVRNVAPIAYVAVSPAWPRPGDLITLQPSVFDPGGDPVATALDMDGATTDDRAFQWDEPGVHEFVLTATDDEGAVTRYHGSVAVVAAADAPIASFDISPMLNCRVDYRGDVLSSFYGATACATFVRRVGDGERLFGPETVPAGLHGNPPYVPVSQRRSGSGTTADPLTITTVVRAQDVAEVTQQDTYVIGDNFTTTRTTVRNLGDADAEFEATYAADCFLQDSDAGLGEHDDATGAVTCRSVAADGVSPGSRIEQFVPLTPDASWVYGYYGTVWASAVAPGALPDAFLTPPDELVDNGLGLEWLLPVRVGASAEVARLTNFSPINLRAVTTAVSAVAAGGGALAVTGTLTNPNTADAQLQAIEVTLPAGLDYRSGSTTGLTTDDPVVDGRTLTWTVPAEIAAEGEASLAFVVDVSGAGAGQLVLGGTAVLVPLLSSSTTVEWGAPASGGAPTASIAPALSISEGGSVMLDATGSTDPDGDALTYAWDLDADGAFDDATGPTPTLALPLVGAYPVSVQVGDGTTTDAATLTAVATNVVPSVSLPAALTVGRDGVVELAGSFTDPGADAWTATVDWGDGEASLPLAGKSFSLAGVLPAAGIHPVTVRVRDAAGGSVGTATVTVTVPPDRAPVVGALGDRDLVEGDSVRLGVAATDPDGDALAVSWRAGAAPLPELPLPTGCEASADEDALVVTCADDAVVVVAATVADAPGGGIPVASTTVQATLRFRNAPPVVEPAVVEAAPGGARGMARAVVPISSVFAAALPAGDLTARAGFSDPGADTFTCGADATDAAAASFDGTAAGGNCVVVLTGLPAGEVTLETWVADDDGGIGRSTTTFEVAAATEPEPTPTDAPAASPTPTPGPTASGSPGSSGTRTDPGEAEAPVSAAALPATGVAPFGDTLLLAALLLVLGGVVLVARRR